jgi:hypothetical protein
MMSCWHGIRSDTLDGWEQLVCQVLGLAQRVFVWVRVGGMSIAAPVLRFGMCHCDPSRSTSAHFAW